MRRVTVSLSLALVVLLGLVASGISTRAQDATPVPMAEHPIVGGWQWENEVEGLPTFISYAVFHPDGTYVEAATNGVTLIGVWQATGGRTVDLTLFATDLDLDPNVTVLGEGRQTVEVDETGNTSTAQGHFAARGPDGAVLFGGEVTSRGTRLEVAPVEPLATPAAATPTP